MRRRIGARPNVFRMRRENGASLALFLAASAWGLYWFPLREMEKVGINGTWTVAWFNFFPGVILIPYVLWFRKTEWKELRKVLFIGARHNAHVLFTQQTTGEYFQRAVFGESELVLQSQAHFGLKAFAVKLNAVNASHHHTSTLHGCAFFKTANVVKLGCHGVILRPTVLQQIS